jgi:hypothetical protein
MIVFSTTIVRAKAKRDRCAFVGSGHHDFALERKSDLLQFQTWARRINGLKKPRPNVPMHVDRKPNNHFSQRTMVNVNEA